MKKLLAILFLATISCFAKEVPLRVGIAMGLPPMVYKENGKTVGVEIDLLKEFAKRNSLKCKLVNLEFKDLISALNEGLIDVAMATMSYTESRAKQVDFTIPYMNISQMPLVHTKHAMRYQNASMLMQTIDDVCVIKDYTGEDFVRENFLYNTTTVASSTEEAIKNLLTNKSQVLVSDSVLVLWLASNYKEDGLLALPISLKREDVCWAVKKGNKELLAKLNNFINTLKAEDKLDDIIRQKIPYYDSKILK